MHAYEISRPARQPGRPIVFDSPHSGFEWPADFRPTATRDAVRATCDAHVERLLANVTTAGATLLWARFPRAYIDPNRAEDARDGRGLIRQEALPGVPLYEVPPTADQVQERIRHYYRPYRAALCELVDEAHAADGVAWHVDVHSVRSRGAKGQIDAGQLRPDIIVSDRLGQTASPALTARIVEWFDALGFRVQMNDPYRGGDLIALTSRPAQNRHSVQINLNRALYMNERTFERTEGFFALQHTLTNFSHELASWV